MSNPTVDEELEKLARRLHEWYLEATGRLDPKNYNPDAQKSYDQLREPQKDIDRYIAGQILVLLTQAKAEAQNELLDAERFMTADRIAIEFAPLMVHATQEGFPEMSAQIVKNVAAKLEEIKAPYKAHRTTQTDKEEK